MTIHQLEKTCRTFILNGTATDAAHDIAHIERVVANAKKLLTHLDADKEVTIAAAWLHDCVVLPKNHPDRKKASVLAGQKAELFLKKKEFPADKLSSVKHAIEAHSYSAGIKPETVEAKIVQDADRLDAIGAIGIARCMIVGGKLDRILYSPDDPFCESREPDDLKYTIDHFYSKLFKLPGTMNTEAGKKSAKERVRYMRDFLEQLKNEIGRN
ncbi:MAG: HD domain-containing protein [Balneolaceae bacterium]|nr:HD domain-containing protein [Balneolaceae bacterium]MCH8547658.1 HD domain-containing protein [Balneolaceae bacterium]